MTLGLCKNCQHWGLHDSGEWLALDVEEDGWSYCALTLRESGKLCEESTKAVAVDSDNYCAALCTTGDFGCVQFEPEHP